MDLGKIMPEVRAEKLRSTGVGDRTSLGRELRRMLTQIRDDHDLERRESDIQINEVDFTEEIKIELEARGFRVRVIRSEGIGAEVVQPPRSLIATW